jgi:uncharacterized cupin superfamily protein
MAPQPWRLERVQPGQPNSTAEFATAEFAFAASAKLLPHSEASAIILERDTQSVPRGNKMTEKAGALAAKLIRNFDTVATEREMRDPLYDTVCARLAPGTAARKLGASIDTVAPGKRSCPYHLHYAQEEMFVVLAGTGTLRVAGEMLPIKTGDVIFIPAGPDYPHQIINTSDGPLKYLSISTSETPEICEYPDSGKYAASAPKKGGSRFRAIQRAETNIDYWDGEP